MEIHAGQLLDQRGVGGAGPGAGPRSSSGGVGSGIPFLTQWEVGSRGPVPCSEGAGGVGPCSSQ